MFTDCFFASVKNIVTCETGIIHVFDTFWGKTLQNPREIKAQQRLSDKKNLYS